MVAARNGTRTARVLLVDDHPLTWDGLRLLLSGEDGLLVCREAGSLETGRAMPAARRPDLILLDPHLPDGNGLSLLEEVRGWADPPRVLVISACDEAFPEVVEAFRHGAAGFVGKPASGDGVLGAVRRVLAGKPEIPDRLIARLIRRPGRD